MNETSINRRAYQVPLKQLFEEALKEYPKIRIDAGTMGGAPCITGTRIPVYMVLDAVRHAIKKGATIPKGTLYCKLDIDQVKQALSFAAHVIECPLRDGE